MPTYVLKNRIVAEQFTNIDYQEDIDKICGKYNLKEFPTHIPCGYVCWYENNPDDKFVLSTDEFENRYQIVDHFNPDERLVFQKMYDDAEEYFDILDKVVKGDKSVSKQQYLNGLKKYQEFEKKYGLDPAYAALLNAELTHSRHSYENRFGEEL